MILTSTSRAKYFSEFGFFVTHACDRCSRPLGAVRWTSRNSAGEFCSEVCREGGVRTCLGCGVELASKSRWCGDTCRKRVRRSAKPSNCPDTPLQTLDLQFPKQGGSHLYPSLP